MTRKWATARSFPSLLPESAAMVTSTVEHLYMHEGRYFTKAHRIAVLEPGASFVFGIETGANTMHMFPVDINSNIAMLEYSFYEDADYSGGTILTPINKNREVNTLSDEILRHSMTVVSDGTEILNIMLIGSEGVGQRRTGGSLSTQAPWLFKPNTKYMGRLTNRNSVSGMIQLNISWFEELVI